jgi:hypothetical protein
MSFAHPRCYATVFFNDTKGGTARRRSWLLDEAMVRLFVSRLTNLTALPIFVLANADNDAFRVLAPWLQQGQQVRILTVDPVVVEPPGTAPWYRLTHTKFQAWALHRECGQVALLDYDGIPLRRMDPDVFDECGGAPLCGVVDQVTPINNAVRSQYLNTGMLVLRPNASFHAWLLAEAGRDARRRRARYYAEQGFFRERGVAWKRLHGGFNVQAGLYKRNWHLRIQGPADPATSDYFLHKKFPEVPGPMQRRLGLRDCAGEAWRAVGRCYMLLHESKAGKKYARGPGAGRGRPLPVWRSSASTPAVPSAAPLDEPRHEGSGHEGSGQAVAHGWQRRLGYSASKLKAAQATGRWLRRRKDSAGGASPPAHWKITDPSQLTDHRPLDRSGLAKAVFHARTRGGGEPVILKVMQSKWRSTTGEWVRAQHSMRPGIAWNNDFANEVFYLEYLRGRPGVPALLGGWRNGSSISLVVSDTGARKLAQGKGFVGQAPYVLSKAYRELARERPLQLARSILSCFRTFSEKGGFFSFDFVPRQFVAAPMAGGGVLFQLVDGPMPLMGPIARMYQSPRNFELAYRRGFSGYGPRPVGNCTSDAHCPTTLPSHCCCSKATRCVAEEGKGAPEARGMCERADPRHPLATRRCMPLSDLTHAFDVATKPWLLPLAAQGSKVVRQLVVRMRHARPDRRLSFSGALEWLDKAMGGGAHGHGSHASVPPRGRGLRGATRHSQAPRVENKVY